MTDQLLDKLNNMGIITTTKSLQKAEDISASSICRRRLPVVLVRMKMAQTMKAAVTFVEQGQVRIGPDVVTDPAYLVTRSVFILFHVSLLYAFPLLSICSCHTPFDLHYQEYGRLRYMGR